MATATQQWLLKVFSGPHAGAEIVLTDGEHVVGSGDDCDIILDDPQIASRHARLLVQDGAIRFTALDDADTYVEGQSVKDSPLEAFQFLTIGDTHLAAGPADAQWPQREAPSIQPVVDESSVDDATDDSMPAEASENKATSPAEDATPTPTKTNSNSGAKARWIISFLALALLVACWLLIAYQAGWFSGETETVVTIDKGDLEKIVQHIAPNSSVEIEPDGEGFMAAGYVLSADTSRKLEDALLNADPTIDVADIDDMEGIEDNARGLLRIRKLQQLEVTAEKPGELIVTGTVNDLAPWEVARQELMESVDVEIEDRVLNVEGKSLVVREPTPAPPPPLPEPNPNGGSTSISEAASDKSPADRPLLVRDVTIGRTKFITTLTGHDVREGSIVRGGFLVKTIHSDHVILTKEGEEVIVHFEVQP